MIWNVRGTVQHVGEDHLVLEVGGIGLRIAVSSSVLASVPEVGKAAFVHTYMLFRQDEFRLYGFATPEERGLFDLLLGISGVGPKLAIGILSALSPDLLRTAVVEGRPEVFTGVQGVGRKTAEKIIFNLKDTFSGPAATPIRRSETDTEVLAALTALGYSLVEAQSALQAIPADAPEDVAARVRLALQYFAQP
ncbi:MAG: Holliday junction branch migration protein RuvA [Anaerolineales bacterium]|jgi:Holliday junction DNA helicase RuvA